MKLIRNGLIVGALIIFAAAFGRVRYVDNATKPSDTVVQESTVVDRGDILLTVSASGPIHAQQETPLLFLGVGRVATINVSEGQHVLKGQTIATLDTRTQQSALTNASLALEGARLALKAVTAAPRSADVASASAALGAAKAGLGAANVGYDPIRVRLAALQVEIAKNSAWQSQLRRDQAVSVANAPQPAILTQIYSLIYQLPADQRDQALQGLSAVLNAGALGSVNFGGSASAAEAQVRSTGYDIGIAQAQLSQTQNAHGDLGSIGAAQAAVVQAQTALDKLTEGADARTIAIAQAQIDQAQSAVDLADYNLARGVLTAPFDGVVGQLNLTIGEAAPLDKAAAILVDNSAYYVDIAVDEIDVSKVIQGQTVTLAFDSLPGVPIAGSVQRVADTSLEVGGVVTYAVRIGIDAGNPSLRAGMSATATITIDHLQNTLRIRNRFVRLDRKTGKASVIVKTAKGQFKEVPVTLGLRNETYSEVRSGLSEGDIVVVLPRDTNLLGL